MTRIIAGTAGGRTLRTPAGDGTRPTTDRVREAVFSALVARDVIAGVDVLDLYAGSGALGLEAASRGAATVTLVEADRRAAAVASANIATLGLSGCRVVTARVAAFLARPAGTAYGLVFLDPPYAVAEDEISAALTALVDGGWLADAALVVVERSTRTPEPTWPEGLAHDLTRTYGETAIHYATHGGGPGLAATRDRLPG